MLFYDFEVFSKDWLVVIMDTDTNQEHVIINDPATLEAFYNAHQLDIWAGFNSTHYDQYILKGILCGFDPKKINDYIIVRDLPGWKYSNLFRDIPLRNYDVMTRLDRGLKFFEGSMGNMVKESRVDFMIQRKLTAEEIEETVRYCRHDVQQTMQVFIHRIDDFNAVMGLIRMFPESLTVDDIGLTKAQISAKILECEYVKRDDEFDLSVLPCIQISKYRQAIDFFMDPDNHDYQKNLTMKIAGLDHAIGWGGIHAGKEKYRNMGKSQGRQIWHVDVASFYPRLMIFHNLLTRNTRKPEKFKSIYEWRIDLKHQGKKKEQAPLKIVINGTYGISKAPTSKAYDPRNANLICMNGQLMLIDLIEKLEVIPGFELIQSNTDGLIVSLPDTDAAFQQLDDICYEWEKRCNMELEFDEIKTMWGQKDVNNYVFEFSNGKFERKGAYVKELGALDYDLPIVNKALFEALVHGTPVETTINNCNELKEFQMVSKISSKYSHILYGGVKLPEKCVRVFASTNQRKGGLQKVSVATGKPAKIANSPEHCFLYNDNVNGVPCLRELNKGWYIDLAKKRLSDFGVSA